MRKFIALMKTKEGRYYHKHLLGRNSRQVYADNPTEDKMECILSYSEKNKKYMINSVRFFNSLPKPK